MEKVKNNISLQWGNKNKKIVHENFFQWSETLLTRDPMEVAKLYTEDATFLPTVSSKFEIGQSGAETYFKHFLEKNPVGEIKEYKIQTIGSDCYLHSGMYNFEVGPDNEREIVEARFTFVWKQDEEGAWKIIHHHSSIKPKE